MFATTYIQSELEFFNQSTHVTTQVRGKSRRNSTSSPVTKERNMPQLLIDRNVRSYPSRSPYADFLMSVAKLTFVTSELRDFEVDSIPDISPLSPLQNLELGWDGYWAEPLSQSVLVKAHQLWNEIRKITIDRRNLPSISPTANGSIAFSWTRHYPRKELEISLIDQPNFLSEWLLSDSNIDTEKVSTSQSDLVKVIRKYLEL
jgi:hypothetical protein